MRRRLGRLWDLVETSDDDTSNTALQIKANGERQVRLEASSKEATASLAQRRAVKDNVTTIAARAQDMSEFLKESELPERRAFIETFVREIAVMPDKAVIRKVLMPHDSPMPGADSEEVILEGSVTSVADRAQ